MGLNVQMTGNATGFQQMLNSARTQAMAYSNAISNSIGASFRGAFVGSVAGLFSFQGISSGVRMALDKVNQLRQLSDELGTDDVEKIQKWGKAFERAGGSIEILTRLVQQFQEKRSQAMGHDMGAIKARQQLEGMGFSKDEINPASGLSMLDFAQRAFHFSNESRSNAVQFEDIFGPRTARYAVAEKNFASAQAPLSQGDYEQAKAAEMKLHELGEAAEVAAGKLLSIEMGTRKPPGWFNVASNVATYGTPVGFAGLLIGKAVYRYTPVKAAYADKAAPPLEDGLQPGVESPTGAELINKPETAAPEDEDLKNLRDQWRKEEDEAVAALHSAQEAHMSIGAKWKLIRQDMAAIQRDIDATTNRLNSPTLGMSKDAYDKMTDAEREEEKHKLQMELYGEQSKKQSFQNELYEKPLDFKADNLQKVGLYSASAIQFNPVLGLQQRANSLLERIATNTSKPLATRPDPHTP